ncbi:hypothetical protein GCM10009630_62550 [Kribbella jejuensis]|uniref:Uncharacterized protein n=1 Tax=Kribbella jejuensis TaxID=236068 RepID=A0A542EAM5_9ACTN|nr:hypothetical protein [Kribbella jejuensis]TQJ12377.1 hypothetical protein FB475_5320 [Kribbella jejuensis]
MTDPTNPPTPRTPTPADDTTELAPVPADPKTAAGRQDAGGSVKAEGAVADGGSVKTEAGADGKKGRRSWAPWVTVGGALVVLALLAVAGYAWGLGPLSRLNAERSITPPAKLAGLDRITDPEIRSRAQLDQTREALSRINDGKKVMVEAYGSLDGDRFYVLIALRGRVDIDKVIADSGATADKVKKIGSTTCIETAGNLPTQCYRGSNTLTVIAQSANEGVNVDQVAPVAEEAYKAMH